MWFCLGIRRAVGRASTSRVQRLRSAWTWGLAISGSTALAERGTTGLLAVSLLVSGTALRSNEAIAASPPEQLPHQIVALTTSQNLLATDPNALARFLETARPKPVSSEDKARVLSTLPPEGEVTDLSASARRKLAALNELLRTSGRESAYEIKVVDVPQAGLACMRDPSFSSRKPHSPCWMRTNSRPRWPTRWGMGTSGPNANRPSNSVTTSV